MFCYHASKIDVLDVGHPVVQVSGAADHFGEDLLLKPEDEKADIFGLLKRHWKTITILPFIFLNLSFM